MSGWFAVKRGITSHPLFKGHPERLAIWLWLLDNAVWQDTPHDVNGKTVVVPRGSVCASERRMADEIGVGRQVIRTFLGRLATERMINPDPTHGRTIISLCNYEKYQSAKTTANPAPNPALTHDQPIKEQENTSVAKATGDPAAVVFGTVRAWLMEATGKSDGAVRRILGGWGKDHSHGEIIDACSRAKREGALDPVAFVEGIWRQQRKRGTDDAERLRAWGIRDLDEDGERNPGGSGDHRSAAPRDGTNDLSGVLAFPAKEERPVSFGDVQAGRDCLELLALRH